MLDLCFDPQTSGGLLIAIAQPAAGTLLDHLRGEGFAESALIGHMTGGSARGVFASAMRVAGTCPPPGRSPSSTIHLPANRSKPR